MDAPFAASDAEAERLRLERTSAVRRWTDGSGRPWDLVIPPTVYPPREDTDLLAAALTALGPGSGRTAFEVGVGSGALLLQLAADGWSVGGCDVHPYAVAASRHVLGEHGHQVRVIESDVRDLDATHLAGADLVVWNTPYLPPVNPDEAHLGPLEEASLSDPIPGGSGIALLEMLAELPARPQRRALLVLRDEGMDGLRMAATARSWSSSVERRLSFEDGEHLVVAMLEPAWPHARHATVQMTGSTNADLLSGERTVGESLRAEQQTEGRGRRAASWASERGDLTASWVIHDGPSPMPAHGFLQAACALATKDVLVDVSGFREDEVLLKWPNDLILDLDGLGKVGGWLIESRQQGRRTRVVAGLGLNLTSGPPTVDGTPRAFLKDQLAEEVHRALTARLCSRLASLTTTMGRKHLAEEAVVAYRASSHRLGLEDLEGESLVPEGLDPHGNLIVQGQDEALNDLDQVHWRLWP